MRAGELSRLFNQHAARRAADAHHRIDDAVLRLASADASEIQDEEVAVLVEMCTAANVPTKVLCDRLQPFDEWARWSQAIESLENEGVVRKCDAAARERDAAQHEWQNAVVGSAKNAAFDRFRSAALRHDELDASVKRLRDARQMLSKIEREHPHVSQFHAVTF